MVEIHQPQEGIRVVAVAGDVPMAQARGLVVEAMRAAQAEGIRGLVIDVSAATALGSPHVGTRLDVVHEWAAALQPGLAIAFVAPASILDPQRVALVVGRGLGLVIDVFTARADAMEWLRTQRGPSAQ